MSNLAANLRQFIRENFLFGRDVPLSDDDSFLDQGIIDSTGVLELVSYLEDTYQIRVADEELVPENLDSIGRVVRYIEGKTEGAMARSS